MTSIKEICSTFETADALAQRIAAAEPGWLPGCGEVVSFTVSPVERIMIVAALREVSLPTLAKTLGSV